MYSLVGQVKRNLFYNKGADAPFIFIKILYFIYHRYYFTIPNNNKGLDMNNEAKEALQAQIIFEDRLKNLDCHSVSLIGNMTIEEIRIAVKEMRKSLLTNKTSD